MRCEFNASGNVWCVSSYYGVLHDGSSSRCHLLLAAVPQILICRCSYTPLKNHAPLYHELQDNLLFITFINLSGGIGIPYRPEQEPNDIIAIGEGVRAVYEEVLVPAGMGNVALYTELGRFMMAPYGHLVTKANECQSFLLLLLLVPESPQKAVPL